MGNKTVCIVTWYKVANFGAFLQAYAMKKILAEKGYDVYFYNYDRKCRAFNKYNLFKHPLKTISRKLFKKKRNVNLSFYEEKNRIFGKEVKQNFLETDISKEYDICLIGSDEIFNIESGYNPFQFFPPIQCKKIISYAASFGETSLEMIRFYNLERQLKDAFLKYTAISVRDENSCRLVEKLTEKSPTVNVDPVLFYGFEKECERMSPLSNSPYIVFYGYDTHIIRSNYITEIKKIAREKKLKILSLGYYHEWCDENINCPPFDFISYIKFASYVVTTTFHGAVFSILLNKNFCVIPQNNTNKLNYLLDQFDLKSQVIKKTDDIVLSFQRTFDSTPKIAQERNKSEEFLRGGLYDKSY